MFLMEEDLPDINLPALHMEMRNNEQLMGSLGLFAHKCGTLQELDAKLSSLGLENFKHNYVKIKESKNKDNEEKQEGKNKNKLVA